MEKVGTLRILVVKMGGGYFKAILPDGQETIYGCEERELLGRLKFRKISWSALIQRGKGAT